VSISTNKPSVTIEDDDGVTLGTDDNPLVTSERSTQELLTDILMELKEMNEKLLIIAGAVS